MQTKELKNKKVFVSFINSEEYIKRAKNHPKSKNLAKSKNLLRRKNLLRNKHLP